MLQLNLVEFKMLNQEKVYRMLRLIEHTLDISAICDMKLVADMILLNQLSLQHKHFFFLLPSYLTAIWKKINVIVWLLACKQTIGLEMVYYKGKANLMSIYIYLRLKDLYKNHLFRNHYLLPSEWKILC